MEQKGNQKAEAKKRTIGNNSMKIALIFFLYLLALNNSIHFTSVNTIVILIFSPFPQHHLLINMFQSPVEVIYGEKH